MRSLGQARKALRANRVERWLILAAILLGGVAGSSAALLFVVASIVFVTLLYLRPEATILGLLAIKPLIDCFWDFKVPVLEGLDLNLQSSLGLAVPAGIVAVGLTHRWKVRLDLLEKSIVAYIVLSLANTILSPSKGAAVIDLLKIVSPFALYWAGRQFGTEAHRPRLIAWVMMLYGLVPLVSGMLEFAGVVSPPPGAEPRGDSVTRVSGRYHHPLDISARCNMALPFALYLADTLPARGDRRRAAVWSVLMTVGGYVTWARSALVATTSQLTYWLWAGRRRLGAAALLLVIVAAGIMVPPSRVVVEDALRPLTEGAIYEFGTGRGFLFAAQVAAYRASSIPEKIFGRGMHSAQELIVLFGPAPAEALKERYEAGAGVGSHNQFLRILLESGVLGVMLVATQFAIVLRRTWRLSIQASDRELRGFARGGMTMLLAVGIYCISIVPLDTPSISWPLWFVIGYTLGMAAQQSDRPAGVGDSTPG